MAWKCTKCDREFDTPQGVSTHERRVHGVVKTGEYPCTWDGCQRTFDSGAGVALHIARTHTKTAIPPSNKSRTEVLKQILDGPDLHPIQSIGRPRTRSNAFHPIDTFIILQDAEGGIWIAERIR